MKNRMRTFALGATVALGGATSAHAQYASDPTSSSISSEATTAIDATGTVHRTFIDAVRHWAIESHIVDRLQGSADGWYPRIGSITRGSGLALGPGFRRHLASNVLFDASADLSIRRYTSATVGVRWLPWNDRVVFSADYRVAEMPRETFYGIGAETTGQMRADYDLRSSGVTFGADARPLSWLHVGASVGRLQPTVSAGRDPSLPSIEQQVGMASIPGLMSQPDFMHGQAVADVDYRDQPGNPTKGGLYHAAFSTWSDRTSRQYDFHRLDFTATQYASIGHDGTHVVSGRVGASLLAAAPGERVPFYMLPYVGGIDTIRSYPEFRFHDNDAIWMGAEYQWTPFKWISGVTFADVGTVAPTWQNINGRSAKHAIGFGIRAHSATQRIAGIDFGFGGTNGWRVAMTFGPGLGRP
jgi:hypothetical protein